MARWLRADHLDRRAVVTLKELEELSGNGPLQASADLANALALGRAPNGVGDVAASSRSRATTTVWSARLSCRSPERFSRCLVTCPDDAGIGLTPAKAANAASDRSRPACDQLTRIWAALIGPIPGNSSSHGATAATSRSSSAPSRQPRRPAAGCAGRSSAAPIRSCDAPATWRAGPATWRSG